MSAFEPFETFELPSVLVDQSILGEDIDKLQMVPLSSCVVIVVMCRRNLDTACPKLSIDHLIGYNF